jgi:SPP1 family predicted phage head-tail adaptor
VLAQRLRHRVDIDEQIEEVASSGEPLGFVWQNWLANVPAEVLTGPGREFSAANAKQAETTARITLRWFAGLTQAHRIRWDGHVYAITGLETDATGRMEWRVVCEDGVNNGA